MSYTISSINLSDHRKALLHSSWLSIINANFNTNFPNRFWLQSGKNLFDQMMAMGRGSANAPEARKALYVSRRKCNSFPKNYDDSCLLWS